MIYIIILVLISGLIAYIGDVLGTYVGKRRLTVLGLRPRITALVVAISTGILITLLTLGVMTILSEDVRTALFYMNSLRQDLETLHNETSSLEQVKVQLEKEKAELTQDVERLTTTVRIKETESVIFRKDEPLAVTVIKTDQSANEVMKELTTLIINLTAKVRRSGVKVQDEIDFFTANKEQLNGMAAHIASSTQDMVVGAIAAENVNQGEQLGDVRFILLPNTRIFQKDQEIASIQIDGRLNRGQIARNLKQFMDEINQEVVRLGMIANPLTGRFGDMSSDSMLSFYDMVNRIKELNRQFILIAVVPADTYAIGPLNVTFRFEETGESIFTTQPEKPDEESGDE
ncbi:MAG: hypothetical protein ACD_39C01488G0003 [uncultured bacterium]|nr:MAG: hypothetical protein ACD_39C01488G0003 [uncultured bacterium]